MCTPGYKIVPQKQKNANSPEKWGHKRSPRRAKRFSGEKNRRACRTMVIQSALGHLSHQSAAFPPIKSAKNDVRGRKRAVLFYECVHFLGWNVLILERPRTMR